MYRVGYRVDLICQDGECLAWSQVYTQPPWGLVDRALAEAEDLAARLARKGITARPVVAVVRLRAH